MAVVDASTAYRPLVLAVDVGTSSVRGLVFDRFGRRLAGVESRVRYAPRATAEGGCELDAADVAALVARVVNEVRSTVDVDGLAFSTVWHGLVGVDEQGNAVTPLTYWADRRAAAVARSLKSRCDVGEYVRRTGAYLHPSFPLPRIAWFREHRPELARSVCCWLSAGDYLARRWTQSALTSVSMASGTGMFDQQQLEWDAEAVALAGIDRQALPRIAAADLVDGDGGPVLLPLGDGACANVGSGCTDRSRIAVTVGTSGAARVLDSQLGAAADGLFAYRLDRRRQVVGGAVNNGGNVVAWLREVLGLASDLDEAAGALSPDQHGLTVLPFLTGERTPYWDAGLRGSVTGLRFDTTRAEVLRAFMEAVAYGLAEAVERLAKLAPNAELRISGAALLHSRSWVQIMADVLGRPLHYTADTEASSRGAALMLLEALGVLEDVAKAREDPLQVVDPILVNHARYLEARHRYRQAVRVLLAES
jgi:gluconokinase